MECLAQITAAAESAVVGNRGQGIVSMKQLLTGHLQAIAPQIFVWRHVQAAMKRPIALPLTAKGGGSQGANGDRLHVMRLNVGHHSLDAVERLLPLRRAFHLRPGHCKNLKPDS